VRKIAHLSDLHFGAVDPAVVEAAVTAVNGAAPDLIVISGDLTQRARSSQFHAARAFLDRLSKPQIVVPGNHDVPLWNVVARGWTPLTKYRRIVSDDLTPFYADAEIAALGLNTARSFTIKDGRLNRRQLAAARTHFAQAAPEAVRIVVTHHPFDQPEAERFGDIVGRARLAIAAFTALGVDLILSGHLHVTRTGPSTTRYPGSGTLLVQAGTATSIRRRGEVNSFNLIEIEYGSALIRRIDWDPLRRVFAEAAFERFQKTGKAWAARETATSPL
jgi:3',5'-cyclic AMP phosphodiesterase CpdA